MPSGSLSLLPLFVGVLGAVGCLIGAFWALRRKRLIDDLPTSKTLGVFIGMAELKGSAESDGPLVSYLAGVRCVHYDWHVEEHWQRIVHETYTDSKGHTQTRTRTESGWTKVGGDRASIPFYLKDDTGVIRVVPEGATINDVGTFNETCSRNDDLYFGKGPAPEIANSTHQRRFHETALPLHTMLYVMGQARERQDMVAAEIAQDKSAPMFLISTRTEKQISRGYSTWFWVWVVLGELLAASGAGVSGIMADRSLESSWVPFVVGGAALATLLVVGWVWTVYNSLVNLHHRVEQGWSQVDVQLKRRYDLIPNLAATVQGYREHEATTQRLVAELRAQTQATPPGIAGPDFKGLSPLLRAVVECYPDLKSSESFLALQRSLADTEERIALARDYFNEIATFYNTRLDIVPDRFVGALAKLGPRTLMGASDFERAPVQVNLVS